MKILLIFTFFLNYAYAIDVVPVKKGDTVQEDGFLVDPSGMKELRQINEDKKLLERKATKLEDLAVINEERIETYRKLSKETEDQLRWEKTKGNFKGIGGFVLGVLATSVAAYAAIRISK
jgi:hypothetical protein